MKLPKHQEKTSTDEVAFRDYRAPSGHGDAVIEPKLTNAETMLSSNVAKLNQHGESWVSLRARARRRLLDDSIRYTSAYRDISWAESQGDLPIVMAGHQPTIFHPGVWFKNFALDHMAKTQGAIAINLVVDNDVASGSSFRIPTISTQAGKATYQLVPYDGVGGGVPFEQREIGDRELFDRFDQTVSEVVRPLVQDPCVNQLWVHARAALNRCGVAGCALAQARHGLEADVGLRTLEIPLGVVCRSREFACFILKILRELPKFQQAYNESSAVYRSAHGIRSSAHPVPDLASDGEWLEAPLWVYSNESPDRKPVWVRVYQNKLEISDRAEIAFSVDMNEDGVDQLAQVMAGPIKIRPRALITTMYARLVLSDLFLHGIGGAKYDQLGDMITRSFFGITPPEYMVLSATIHLPGHRDDNYECKVRSLRRALRDERFQPERFAQHISDQTLVERKASLIAEIPPKGQRANWHRQVTSLNREMSEQLSSVREELLTQLQAAESDAASRTILQSREHPFCVFPLDYLVDNFRKLLA